jgi:hypothetical protein
MERKDLRKDIERITHKTGVQQRRLAELSRKIERLRKETQKKSAGRN